MNQEIPSEAYQFGYGHSRDVLAERHNPASEEILFCTEDNLEQSLRALCEEFESFGIAPIDVESELHAPESLRKLTTKTINAAWKLKQKLRSVMRLQDQLVDLNRKTNTDNLNLKNHVKRLQGDAQKKEHLLCEAHEREKRLKLECQNVSRDLKHGKDEVQKLKKQAQSKDTQHEHEVRRIMQSADKLQEQLRKSVGTFVPRDKVLQKMQADHEKELSLYKQTICRLEENNRQMLHEINQLKDALALYSTAVDLQIEASEVWTDACS